MRLEFIIRAEALVFGIAGALTPFIVKAARRFPLVRNGLAVSLALHVVCGTLFGLTVKLLWDLAILPFYSTPWVMHFSWKSLQTSMLSGLQTNVMLYWVIVIGVTALDHAHRYRHSAIEAVELRAQLAEAQLQALRIQLDPHFLFNTMHSISELVHADPDAAEAMITDLSDLLRLSLAHRDRHEITLSEEIEFVRLYLDIQSRRFEQRLAVRYEIGLAAENALIPSMILQPLVENSIRHAIAPRRGGGTVLIRAGIDGLELRLEVEDLGGLPAVLPEVEGLGLRTTRERLEKMYSGEHRFELLPGLEGMMVRVCLPYHWEASRA